MDLKKHIHLKQHARKNSLLEELHARSNNNFLTIRDVLKHEGHSCLYVIRPVLSDVDPVRAKNRNHGFVPQKERFFKSSIK